MPDLMEKIVSLAKRRGFVFQSSEIYGGFGSCYDFGPQGVELKNNIKQSWWKYVVQDREDVVGLDSAILMSPKIWQASGHLSAGFADEMVECKKCGLRSRYSDLVILNDKEIKKHLEDEHTIDIPSVIKSQGDDFKRDWRKCKCGAIVKEKPRKFNLMMKTFYGPVEDSASTAYLRAETCQGIYVNFLNVLQSQHTKIPFGIGQIGKAFRNEITPGNFIFRTREFEQMEMQYFVKPGENKNFFEYWKKERMKWYLNLGIKKENLRFHEQTKDELAHYAKQAVDIEYKFPFGWSEIEGIHDRGNWDLSNHAKHSGKDLAYFDEKTPNQSKLGSGQAKEKFIPNIIETSAGADRTSLMFLIDAYQEEKVKDETRVVLKINKKLAPIKVAILPLARNKSEITDLARKIFNDLRDHFTCKYDDTGSIGRLYRRQDEIGTPYCVTVDFDSLEDKKVTVRNRDTMKQERIEISRLKEILKDKF